MFCSVLCLLCLCARLFLCVLWSPAVKGLTSRLSFVVSNCEFVTFPLVSWVRCGTWLYRFLIFAPLLTLLLIVTPIVGDCNCSMFCSTLLYVPICFAILLMGKRVLVELLSVSSCCLVIVVMFFLAVPWVYLQFVFWICLSYSPTILENKANMYSLIGLLLYKKSDLEYVVYTF